jgi:hypothetical protein
VRARSRGRGQATALVEHRGEGKNAWGGREQPERKRDKGRRRGSGMGGWEKTRTTWGMSAAESTLCVAAVQGGGLSAARARARDGLHAACYAWAAGKAGWGARGMGRPGEKPSWARGKGGGCRGQLGPRSWVAEREEKLREFSFYLFLFFFSYFLLPRIEFLIKLIHHELAHQTKWKYASA